MELRPHQQANRDRLISILGANGAALDGSDTGTGKTYAAVGMAEKLRARPAIVCPRACIHSWVEVCEGFGVEPFFVANYEKCRAGSFTFGGFNLKGKIQQYTWKPDGRVVFFWDEVQRCKAEKSLNSSMLLAAAHRYKNVLLSATPFTTPLEAYSIGSTLHLFTQNQYWNWLFKHNVRKNFLGKMEFRGGVEDMEKIHQEIFPAKGVRTRREEIPGFPKTQILTQKVETGEAGEIEKAYMVELEERRARDKQRVVDQIEEAAKRNEYFESLPSDWKDGVEALPITIDLRARQEAEILKCGVMVEMAKDALDKNDSVALFVNFDSTIEILARRLNTTCVLRGKGKRGGNNYDAFNSVKAFQENRSNVILVNNAAGGAGVNLHDPVTQKPRTSLISPPWSAITLKQVLGRPHRDGGGYSTQHILFAAGTVEERVMKRVDSRLNNLDALTDGDLDPFTE